MSGFIGREWRSNDGEQIEKKHERHSKQDLTSGIIGSVQKRPVAGDIKARSQPTLTIFGVAWVSLYRLRCLLSQRVLNP
jgi:hypothetical protein